MHLHFARDVIAISENRKSPKTFFDLNWLTGTSILPRPIQGLLCSLEQATQKGN